MELTFLNTWHGTLSDELREYVKEACHDTDVFCFQEAHANEQSAYQDLLEDYQRYYGEKLQSNLLLSNVIFVRKGIEVVTSGTLLEEGSNIGFANYVVLRNDGVETSVCNVHGIPHPWHKLDTLERIKQSQVIIDYFSNEKRVVIGGDFNLLPESQSVKMFERNGYRNLIRDYAIKSTRNHISLDVYPNNPQYYADYAFTSLDIDVIDFTVPAAIVSDHQPLRISLRATSRNTTTNSSQDTTH
jgi:endonuclease/exonuclease/phosphatase family metal-dependent hydrolase